MKRYLEKKKNISIIGREREENIIIDDSKQNNKNYELPEEYCVVFDNKDLKDKLKYQGSGNLCWDYALVSLAEIIVKEKNKSIAKLKTKINELILSEKYNAYYFRRPQSDKLNNYQISDYLDENIYKKVYQYFTADEHEAIRSIAFINDMLFEANDLSLNSRIDENGLFKNQDKPKHFDADVNIKEAIIYDFRKTDVINVIKKVKELLYRRKALLLKIRLNNNDKSLRTLCYRQKGKDIENEIATICNNDYHNIGGGGRNTLLLLSDGMIIFQKRIFQK